MQYRYLLFMLYVYMCVGKIDRAGSLPVIDPGQGGGGTTATLSVGAPLPH